MRSVYVHNVVADRRKYRGMPPRDLWETEPRATTAEHAVTMPGPGDIRMITVSTRKSRTCDTLRLA